VLHLTTRALAAVLNPGKIYVCSFGEAVQHVHWYVIPRLPGMPESGLSVLLQMMRERTWACSDAEAAALVTRVRREVDRLTRLDTQGG
jgi:diadenosine tetraphosphate (Ap4A) HIT family hydrolase